MFAVPLVYHVCCALGLQCLVCPGYTVSDVSWLYILLDVQSGSTVSVVAGVRFVFELPWVYRI